MTHEMSEEEIYEAAKKRVRQKRDFYSHIAAYVIVNAFLVVIWAITSRGYPWFIWPIVGWGVGLIFHAMDIFVFHKGPGAEKEEIEKEMEKLKKGQ